MNNRHITRFGDPTTISGARYIVSDQEGLLQMALELEQARYIVMDIPSTETLRVLATDRVKRDFGVLVSKLKSQVIPNTLTQLLSISKKADVEKYGKTITLEEFDLFLLLHNCERLGFSHRSTFPEFRPSHLIITKSDTDKLKEKNFRPYDKKITPLMRERRKIHAHLLEKGTDWHCFYFSYKDVQGDHFKLGPHIHYINHLWTYDKEETWKGFDTRFTKIGDAIHMRFKPFEYLPPLTMEISPRTANNPMLFAIDTDLPSNGNAKPIALAQIITRGSMSTDIHIHPKFEKQFVQEQHMGESTITMSR